MSTIALTSGIWFASGPMFLEYCVIGNCTAACHMKVSCDNQTCLLALHYIQLLMLLVVYESHYINGHFSFSQVIK